MILILYILILPPNKAKVNDIALKGVKNVYLCEQGEQNQFAPNLGWGKQIDFSLPQGCRTNPFVWR